MAIGLAFVDIVGDTSRTEAQIERDMNRVIGEVEDAIDPIDVHAEIDRSDDRRLLSDLNEQIADLQSRARDLSVNPNIDEFWRHNGLQTLNRDIAALQAEADRIRVDTDTGHIAMDLSQSVREAVRVAEAAAPPIEIETRVDDDRVSRSLSGIASGALAALGPVQSLGTALVGLGAAAPALSGVAAALSSMAPAAAVAAPAILAVVSANAAVKLGTLGIEDAVKAAFDPSHPEKFAEALKGLAPNAQSFVKEINNMRPALKDLQQSVQNELFRELDTSLKLTSDVLLPVLKTRLTDTASALGDMAGGVLKAGEQLGTSGTLGKALDSSNAALSSLSEIPGQLLTAFGQLAAAAGPSLERFAAAVGNIARALSGELAASFESGGLQKAIEGGVGQVNLLFGALKNVFKIFGDINLVASEFGGGSLGAFKDLTGEIEKFTSSKAFQDALRALFGTIQQLTQTALPLLGQALAAIGPVLQALLPGVQAIIAALGPALSQVIAALAPVLLAAAQAISSIVVAVSPLITLLGTLISAVLPILTPLLNAVVLVFNALAPIIAQIAQILSSVFVPIINTLVQTVLPPLVQVFTTVISAILPVFGKLLEALTPALTAVSVAIVALFEALGPLIQAFANLIGPYLQVLVPILIPIIDFVGKLATVLANTLAQLITTVVVPALNVITNLLKGDFSAAWQSAKQVVKGYIDFMIQIFVNLPAIITDLVIKLGQALFAAGKEAFGKLRDAAVEKLTTEFFPWLNQMSSRVAEAVGNLGGTLIQAGRDVIQGFLNGIKSKIGELRSLLGGITDMIPVLKGPADRDRVLLTPAGQMIMDGLMVGIGSRIPALRSQLAEITNMFGTAEVPGPNIRTGSARIGGAAGRAHFAGLAGGIVRMATPTTNVQVFIGDRELTDIVDTRVSAANRMVGAQIAAGMRT